MAKYKLQVIFGLAILVCFVNFFKRTKMLNKEKLKKRRKELKYSQKILLHQLKLKNFEFPLNQF